MGWLDEIQVAAPCRSNWEEMEGDERSRYCAACKLNVFNLSGMTREQAEHLVSSAEGRVCVRFFRRRDGTVLTQDCPIGLGAVIKRRTVAVAGWFLGFLGVGSIAGFAIFKEPPPPIRCVVGMLPPRNPPTLPTNGTVTETSDGTATQTSGG